MRPSPYDPVDSNSAPQRKTFLDYSWKSCTMFGIPIYIHYLMPLFFILSFLFWARQIADDSGHFVYYFFLICLQNAVLWETVLVHELGHCLAGWLVGGHTDKVLLWPLGGLAFTSPPSSAIQSHNTANRSSNIHSISTTKSNRCAQIIIALGGPFTHIPHMMIYGGLLYWIGQHEHNGVYIHNPFVLQDTWNETIYTPITKFIDYDFFMLAFTLNFWLFVVNLLLPAFPLDGSRIFVNILRSYCSLRTTGQIYCVVNGILSVGFIIVSYSWLQNGSMLQFAGLWGAFQVYVMVQYIIQGRESQHPLIYQADNNT